MPISYHDPSRPRRSPHQTLLGRDAGDSLSLPAYASALGCLILLGYAVAGLTAALSPAMLPAFVLLPLGIALAYLGLEITTRTPDWRGSVAGHTLANIGFGCVLAPLLALAGVGWLWAAGAIVILGTAILTLIAAIFPAALKAFGSCVLATALAWGTLHLTASLWGPLLLAVPPPHAGSALAALLYLGLTDRYWSRALELARNLDNAADSACALYADAVDSLLTLIDSPPRSS